LHLCWGPPLSCAATPYPVRSGCSSGLKSMLLPLARRWFQRLTSHR